MKNKKLRNFYHSCKFCTLTKNFSKVWPRQILLHITIFAVRLRNVLNTSRRLVYKNSLTWWNVLKTSWRHLWKTSWRCLEDIFKTSQRRLENVLKTSWRRMARTNILVLIKTSWRRLEDALWRRMIQANIFVLMKTSSRRLPKTKTKDVFKTSSRCLNQDECLLGLVFLKILLDCDANTHLLLHFQ